ncbi:MAG: Rieske 2Fe-2S domain-containing protein [Planctomycetes bacterium]|nr:Rieske 2Fe-2S domain-containing protein [Planctomycetota bacterium]
MRDIPEIDPDIHRARTLPGAFYGDADWFGRQRELLARSWHMAPLDRGAPAVGHAVPWALLPGALDEPLVWTRDRDGIRRCLSNVCTHRGRVVVDRAGPSDVLACGYHGRCFGLDGALRAAPGFENAPDFPAAADDLPAVATGDWAGFAFAALDPAVTFAEWIAPLLAWAPELALPDQPSWLHDYEFDAHWALYVDNYLEGFHIPFVHPALQRTLTNDYDIHLLDGGASVQVAFSRPGEPALELGAAHPGDYGDRPVAALYVFLFPGTLMNFYPWGLSINRVEPLAPRRTRVRYVQYVARPELRQRGAGGDLETVEAEDQAVVLATQHGVRARLYDRGRYAPVAERAVHHFHRAVAHALVAGRVLERGR